MIMCVTNPKVVIFFLAFLPQFTDPAAGSLTLQLMMLGVIFIVTTLMVFASVAWGAGMLGDWLKGSERAQIILNRIAGTVFAALAIRLIAVER